MALLSTTIGRLAITLNLLSIIVNASLSDNFKRNLTFYLVKNALHNKVEFSDRSQMIGVFMIIFPN